MVEATPAEATSSDTSAEAKASTRGLPNYARSLLKVSVPVSVTLAAKRQSVREVLELVPGSLITFEKPCHEFLELSVNDRPVARGEAVKVGESFGLRIAEIVRPDERFEKVSAQPDGRAAQSA